MEVRSSERDDLAFRKAECTLEQAYIASAQLFDAAMVGAKMRNQDVAGILDVSESLVQKWRSPEARVCPSHVQMLQLPLTWHIAHWRAMSKRYGLGRAMLRRVLDAVGDFALLESA